LLYIPHGSDERKMMSFPFGSERKLYIPHGSDESASFTDFAKLSTSFISHMVQMKGKNRRAIWKK